MKQTPTGVLAAVAVLAAAGITSWGLAEPTVTARWSPPTYGTPVEHYVLELETWASSGGDTLITNHATAGPDTAMAFEYGYGYSMRCRVAGVDAQGRQGPFSLWSNTWTDNGPPGEPTNPFLFLRMEEQ
jgi:hypothetical protein